MTDISIRQSPFSPGRPVQPEYFVARTGEIQRVERALTQTVLGRNENIFVMGQRGIGKSSLAKFVLYLAQKEHSFVGAHCFLGGVRSLEDMVGVIFQWLLQNCTDKSLFDKLREGFGTYIKGLKLFGIGVEFTKDKGELRTLVENFLPVMRKIHEQIASSGRRGLILILDDLNGITDVPQFSQFLKSFVDELATSDTPLPLFLVLVGLPQRRDDLIKHQPSLARIFDIIDLPTMSKSESEDFFITTFDAQDVTLTSEALSLLVQLSSGFPMLMYEVGDAVFWQDTDGHVDESDAMQGIMEAAGIIGKKYIDPKIANVLRSKTYSSILWRIGGKLPLGATFQRGELLKEVPQTEQKNLDNFLSRMKKLGIVEDGEARGEYRFVNPLYHLYLWYEARKKTK